MIHILHQQYPRQCKPSLAGQSARLSVPRSPVLFGFWFLVCNAATQLATQLPQGHIQVVRSNKVAQKRLTESNGNPAMDLEPMNID